MDSNFSTTTDGLPSQAPRHGRRGGMVDTTAPASLSQNSSQALEPTPHTSRVCLFDACTRT